jgi:hypothetical protein
MASIIRNVRAFDTADRQHLERILGQALRDDQQIIIQVVSPTGIAVGSSTDAGAAATPQTAKSPLPDWCNVYDDLSDREIQEIEKIILTRADLTRPSQ